MAHDKSERKQENEMFDIEKDSANAYEDGYKDGITQFTKRLASLIYCIPETSFNHATVLRNMDDLLIQMLEERR